MLEDKLKSKSNEAEGLSLITVHQNAVALWNLVNDDQG
jgi:hypothetical protein